MFIVKNKFFLNFIATGGEINEEEEKTANYLEMTIRTKWGGAQFQWIPNN